jgi:RNA polymerase sigma-70 factor (ECF subfamily)
VGVQVRETWACKFVIFEVSAKIGRHFWRHPSVPLDAEDWDRLPARFGFDPAYQAEWRELFAAPGGGHRTHHAAA